MVVRWKRAVAGAGVAGVLLGGVAGCSDDSGGPSDAASKAASALSSVGSSLASEAGDVLASATAEAGKKLEEIKDGVDAKGDVTLGSAATDPDGRTTVKVTVRNTADSAKSFGVQVVFKDGSGKLLDTVVVTVDDVAAGKTGEGTAQSHRKLDGQVTAEVENALRY
ncbi:hypothetical protein [Streptomyces sp. NPDC101132]|uniref:hypothetical protein n=1 Tax=Streptomyces sp. NPDC101132 TaxID=3366110 RepID=UPI0038005D4C